MVALALLGLAVWLNNGLYSRPAVFTLIASLAVFAHCLFLRSSASPTVPTSVVNGFAAIVIAFQGVLLLSAPPLNDVVFRSPISAWPHYAAWITAIAAALGVAWCPSRYIRPLFLLLAASVATAGIWTIHSNPTPRVDVFYFQRDASTALLQGTNPYRLTFPNPYTPEESWVYAPSALQKPDSGSPSTSVPDRLLFGFPYMPATLLAVAPAQWILGDFRYAHLLWIVLPATLTVLVVRTRTAALAMALLLTFPRLPWVLEWGWTEPVLAGSLLLTLLAARSMPSLAPLPLALFLSAKQYMALVAPLAFLLPRRSTPVFVTLTLLLGCLLTLPLVLWDFPAFWSSAVTLQFQQPFRPDALSLPALVFDLTGYRLPETLSLGVAVVLSVLLLRWLPNRSVTNFAIATALVLPLFFFLSKQAFANYYFLAFALWSATLAQAEPHTKPPHPNG